MPTKYFNLPEIDPAAKFDGANDINKLANAIDSALDIVATRGQDAKYKLPAATATRLGGVIIGRGVNVDDDGTISVDSVEYVLPPATKTQLGGVIVSPSSGFKVSTDGTLSIDDNSLTLPANSVGTAQLQTNAVTNPKIADGAVTLAKLDNDLQKQVQSGAGYVAGRFAEADFVFDSNTPITEQDCLQVRTWGPAITYRFDNCPVTLTASSNTIGLGYVNDSGISANGFLGNTTSVPYYNAAGNIVGYCYLTHTTVASGGNNYAHAQLVSSAAIPAGTYYIKDTITAICDRGVA